MHLPVIRHLYNTDKYESQTAVNGQDGGLSETNAHPDSHPQHIVCFMLIYYIIMSFTFKLFTNF